MLFIDCHCHVAENYFYKQIDSLIPHWIENRIKIVAAMATNLKTSKRNIEIAKEFPEIIHAAIARHPWGAHKFDERERKLFSETITLPEVKIVGEIGLDNYFIKDKEQQKKQKEVLDFFLELANKNKKPIMLHQTGAEKELYELLTTHTLTNNFCCHWYSGDVGILKKIVELDAFFSINPAIKYSEKHQQVINIVPLERILTESDGGVKFEGKPSSPLLIPDVCKYISGFKKISIEEVIKQIDINYNDFLTY